jgi:hypothetical protein
MIDMGFNVSEGGLEPPRLGVSPVRVSIRNSLIEVRASLQVSRGLLPSGEVTPSFDQQKVADREGGKRLKQAQRAGPAGALPEGTGSLGGRPGKCSRRRRRLRPSEVSAVRSAKFEQ